MRFFKKKADHRVCVIGLDGVPFGMIEKLASSGVMPAAAGLMARGSLRPMKASVPEISSVSWSDFMTGRDSGSHGIFGFIDLRPGRLATRFPDFRDLKTDTFWDELGRRGKKCIVLNQPATYPARVVPGVLVSGFVALELERSVYPASLLPGLKKAGYATDIDIPECRRDRNRLKTELFRTADGLEDLTFRLWNDDWDYFQAVVTGTDRIHHFMWSAYEDTAHPRHDMFLDYYRRVDRFIGLTAAAYEKLTGGLDGFYMLSDHGFTGIVQEVYLNSWLRENGWLDLDTAGTEGLEGIGPSTRAFALDPSRIYLNLKDRFPGGTVDREDKDRLAGEIADRLLGLEYNGKKIIRRVFRNEEIYHGPQAAAGPDLVAISEPGFDLKGSLKKRYVFGRTDLEGMHTWDDAFFFSSSPVGGDLAIKDLAPLFLERLK